MGRCEGAGGGKEGQGQRFGCAWCGASLLGIEAVAVMFSGQLAVTAARKHKAHCKPSLACAYLHLPLLRSDIAVGTHALISDSTQFKQLGLAVVDEQHK